VCELFGPIPYEELPFRNIATTHQLRFNGDRAAFVDGAFTEFYSLLMTGHVVWYAPTNLF
jgi:hypothetical protein